jgi:antitoxin HigA-1
VLGRSQSRVAAFHGKRCEKLQAKLMDVRGVEAGLRLSLAFGTTAESWMSQQIQYDLWHVERRRKKLRVAKLSAA